MSPKLGMYITSSLSCPLEDLKRTWHCIQYFSRAAPIVRSPRSAKAHQESRTRRPAAEGLDLVGDYRFSIQVLVVHDQKTNPCTKQVLATHRLVPFLLSEVRLARLTDDRMPSLANFSG